MNKLLQAPRGCPTYGKEHWSHQAGAIWDLGKRQHCRMGSTSLHLAEPSHLAPPPHSAAGITNLA